MRMRRTFLVSAGALVLSAALSAPGGAQTTTETRIAYAAESSSAGLELAITAPGSDTPAAGIFGAATASEVSSDGPEAAGQADALAVLTASPVTASSSAPPDEENTATSPIPVITIPSVGEIAALQGSAQSSSEAQDETPSTHNTGSLGALSVDIGLAGAPGLGDVAASVDVAQVSTSSDAAAPRDTNLTAGARTDGVVISADLDIELLQEVCSNIPVVQLQAACNALATEEQLLSVTLGPSNVECSWNGRAAECAGDPQTALIDMAGTTQSVAPGQTVTIPPEGPFLVRVRAGNCDAAVEGDEGSAICSGISVELLGPDPANPGVLTFAIGQTTAGVAGEVDVESTIARTGGSLLPLFLGGSALVLAGAGIRRYLKRD